MIFSFGIGLCCATILIGTARCSENADGGGVDKTVQWVPSKEEDVNDEFVCPGSYRRHDRVPNSEFATLMYAPCRLYTTPDALPTARIESQPVSAMVVSSDYLRCSQADFENEICKEGTAMFLPSADPTSPPRAFQNVEQEDVTGIPNYVVSALLGKANQDGLGMYVSQKAMVSNAWAAPSNHSTIDETLFTYQPLGSGERKGPYTICTTDKNVKNSEGKCLGKGLLRQSASAIRNIIFAKPVGTAWNPTMVNLGSVYDLQFAVVRYELTVAGFDQVHVNDKPLEEHDSKENVRRISVGDTQDRGHGEMVINFAPVFNPGTETDEGKMVAGGNDEVVNKAQVRVSRRSSPDGDTTTKLYVDYLFPMTLTSNSSAYIIYATDIVHTAPVQPDARGGSNRKNSGSTLSASILFIVSAAASLIPSGYYY